MGKFTTNPTQYLPYAIQPNMITHMIEQPALSLSRI
jgi:hypothetical protein